MGTAVGRTARADNVAIVLLIPALCFGRREDSRGRRPARRSERRFEGASPSSPCLRQALPAKLSTEHLSVLRFGKAEHDEVAVVGAHEERAPRRRSGVREVAEDVARHFCHRKGDPMRPMPAGAGLRPFARAQSHSIFAAAFGAAVAAFDRLVARCRWSVSSACHPRKCCRPQARRVTLTKSRRSNNPPGHDLAHQSARYVEPL